MPTNTNQAPQGADPLLGRVLDDRFRLISLIARGGMGRVYKAEQMSIGRAVALKVLAEPMDGNNQSTTGTNSHGTFQNRFFREAATCARITHPNIVTMIDYGKTDDGLLYIAMEFIEGTTLRKLVQTKGALEPGRAIHIMAQVARALRDAHTHGLIHRDVKPANIFVTQRDGDPDFVKVVDFGIVKSVGEQAADLTETGLVVGTPKYMAPEQIKCSALDGRTDIYSLGVVFFELLCGAPPFGGRSNLEIAAAHLTEQPPSLADRNPVFKQIPNVCAVVERCIQKDPNARFIDMEDFLLALAAAAREDTLGVETGSSDSLRMAGVQARDVSASGSWPSQTFPRQQREFTPPGQEAARPKGSRFGLWLGSAAVTALAIGGGGFYYIQQKQEQEVVPRTPPAVQLAVAPQSAPAPQPVVPQAEATAPAPESPKASSKVSTKKEKRLSRKPERQATRSVSTKRNASHSRADASSSKRVSTASNDRGRITGGSAPSTLKEATPSASSKLMQQPAVPAQEVEVAEMAKPSMRTETPSTGARPSTRGMQTSPPTGAAASSPSLNVPIANYSRLPRAEVRAAAVFQLLRHEATLERRCGAEIRVGVVGNRYRAASMSDARNTTRILDQSLRSKNIRNRSVSVHLLPIGNLEDVRVALRNQQFNVLYLGTDLGVLVRAINRLAGSTRTLVVSDEPRYFLSDTTVVFVTEGKKMKLLVNMKSARRQNVAFDSTLLSKADVFR